MVKKQKQTYRFVRKCKAHLDANIGTQLSIIISNIYTKMQKKKELEGKKVLNGFFNTLGRSDRSRPL